MYIVARIIVAAFFVASIYLLTFLLGAFAGLLVQAWLKGYDLTSFLVL